MRDLAVVITCSLLLGCAEAGLDLVFVLDESLYVATPAGVAVTYFDEMKTYVTKVISYLDIGRQASQTQVRQLLAIFQTYRRSNQIKSISLFISFIRWR